MQELPAWKDKVKQDHSVIDFSAIHTTCQKVEAKNEEYLHLVEKKVPGVGARYAIESKTQCTNRLRMRNVISNEHSLFFGDLILCTAEVVL